MFSPSHSRHDKSVHGLWLLLSVLIMALPAPVKAAEESRDIVFELDPHRNYPRFEFDVLKVITFEGWIGDSGHRFHFPATLDLDYPGDAVQPNSRVPLTFTFTPHDGAGPEYDLERGIKFEVDLSFYSWGVQYGDDIEGDFVPPMSGESITLSQQSVEIWGRSIWCVGGISIGLYRSEEFNGQDAVLTFTITNPANESLVHFEPHIWPEKSLTTDLPFQNGGDSFTVDLVIEDYSGPIEIQAASLTTAFNIEQASAALRPGFDVWVVSPRWYSPCHHSSRTVLFPWFDLDSEDRAIPLDDEESEPLSFEFYSSLENSGGADRAQDVAEDAERKAPDPPDPDDVDPILVIIRNVHDTICDAYEQLVLNFFVDDRNSVLPIGTMTLNAGDPALMDFNNNLTDSIAVQFDYEPSNPNYILTKGHVWSLEEPFPRYIVKMTALNSIPNPLCETWHIAAETDGEAPGNLALVPFEPPIPDFAVDSLRVDGAAYVQFGDEVSFDVHVSNLGMSWPPDLTLTDPEDSIYVDCRVSYEKRVPPPIEWEEVIFEYIGQQLLTPMEQDSGGWYHFMYSIPLENELNPPEPLDRIRFVFEANDGSTPGNGIVWERSFQNNAEDASAFLSIYPDSALASGTLSDMNTAINLDLPTIEVTAGCEQEVYLYVADSSFIYPPGNLPPPLSVWLGFGPVRSAPDDSLWTWQPCTFVRDHNDDGGADWKVFQGDVCDFQLADTDTHSYCFRASLNVTSPDPAYVYVDSDGISTVDGHDNVYYYWLSGLVLTNTAVGSAPELGERPFDLAQNYPNPFNPSSTIEFVLAQAGPVQLAIYDQKGRRIRELIAGSLPAGLHSVRWDGRDDAGRNQASGIYFYRLTAAGRTETRKMALLR